MRKAAVCGKCESKQRECRAKRKHDALLADERQKAAESAAASAAAVQAAQRQAEASATAATAAAQAAAEAKRQKEESDRRVAEAERMAVHNAAEMEARLAADFQARLAKALAEARAQEDATTAHELASLRVPEVTRALVWGRGELEGESLGQGGFGRLHTMFMVGGALVAVKSLDADRHSTKGEDKLAMRALQNEIKLMYLCAACPNVLRVYGLLGEAPQNSYVMEAADYDLRTRIDRAYRAARYAGKGGGRYPTWALHARWGEYERQVIACGVAAGLEYIHGQGIVHCDLKPANILLIDGVAKLCDFGASVIRSSGSAAFPLLDEQVGTPAFFAPEWALARRAYILWKEAGGRSSPRQGRRQRSVERVAPAVDTWAFGLILECLGTTSTSPSHMVHWAAESVKDLAVYLSKGIWVAELGELKGWWDDIVQATTRYEPRERPSMSLVRLSLMGKQEFASSSVGGAPAWQSTGRYVEARAHTWEAYAAAKMVGRSSSDG